jgi:pimeloyl-ACP methyl ester carboxylesterase
MPDLSSLTRLTTGGLQFWTDHLYRDGYRIQQNALSDEWRLLTPTNHRVVSGKREDCVAELNTLSSIDAWNQIEAPFVVLLHGLLRTSNCMRKMQHALNDAGFKHVVRYSYASTRASILDHGAALKEYVESLPSRSKLSFIGHSMGNIVLRAAIGYWSKEQGGNAVLSRMHRVVMLGPPNQGATIARWLAPTGIFGMINGPGGMELGPRWSEIKEHLGVPPCPFAILAGDRTGQLLNNPLLGEASDLLVTVDEAKLDGAADLKIVSLPHTTLMTDKDAIQYATDFILRP